MDDARDRTTHLLSEIRIEASVHVVVGRVGSSSSSSSRSEREKSIKPATTTTTNMIGGEVSSSSSSSSPSSPPPLLLDTKTLNHLIQMETKEGVAMLFLQLPDTPIEGSTNDEIMLYVRNLREMTASLPPLALVKSARQRTTTTEL